MGWRIAKGISPHDSQVVNSNGSPLRALINRPRILLADEPTGNLDPATGNEVLAVLRELQSTGKQTLLMATHNPQIAALADRRIQLDQLH